MKNFAIEKAILELTDDALRDEAIMEINQLRAELDRVKAENERLKTQYTNLWRLLASCLHSFSTDMKEDAIAEIEAALYGKGKANERL